MPSAAFCHRTMPSPSSLPNTHHSHVIQRELLLRSLAVKLRLITATTFSCCRQRSYSLVIASSMCHTHHFDFCPESRPTTTRGAFLLIQLLLQLRRSPFPWSIPSDQEVMTSFWAKSAFVMTMTILVKSLAVPLSSQKSSTLRTPGSVWNQRRRWLPPRNHTWNLWGSAPHEFTVLVQTLSPTNFSLATATLPCHCSTSLNQLCNPWSLWSEFCSPVLLTIITCAIVPNAGSTWYFRLFARKWFAKQSTYCMSNRL